MSELLRPSRQPDAILFDLDGTLIDTYRLYLESYRRALEPHLGYAPTDEEIAGRHPSSERRFLTDWLGVEAGEACHAEVRRWYAELHASHSQGMYDGVREMLDGLRSAGLRLGIVTGKGRDAWAVTEAAMDLGAFDVIITDDDVHAAKPDPGGLLAAADALGIAPAQAVYIGDSTVDMKAGRNAGDTHRRGAVGQDGARRGGGVRAQDRRDAAGLDLRPPGGRHARVRDVVLRRSWIYAPSGFSCGGGGP